MSRLPLLASRGAAVALAASLTASCGFAGTPTIKPPASPAGAHVAGSLRVGITAPTGLDPIAATDPSAQLVSSALCDTLVAIDPRTGFPVPGLLETWNTSGKTLTLQLHHGIHMSDGHTLNANDVAYSLSRLANASLGSPAARLLTEVAGFQGFNANLFAKATDTLSSIQVIDQYDLQVTLTDKDPGFIYTLASPATAPVSERAARTNPREFAANPICVGPYRLHQPYSSGAKQIVLDRVPGYYARNFAFTGGGKSYAAHVVFDIYPSQAAAYAAFRSGALDLVEQPPAAPAAAAPASAAPSGATLVTSPTDTEEFIGLPDGLAQSVPGASLGIALSRAIDRNAVIAGVWGAGGAQPAGGFLPAGFGLAVVGTSCGASTPANGDPAGARALLSAGQLATLAKTPLTITVNNDYNSLAEARLIAAQWHNAFGMTVNVASKPWNDYLQQATVGAGFGGPFRVSWQGGGLAPTPTNTDPARFLAAMFSTNSFTEGNWAHYSDLRFDTLYKFDAQPASLGLARFKAVKGLAAYLCQRMPVIPLAVQTSQWLVRSSTWASARSSYLSADGTPLLRELYLR